ncbi:hypothetical protein ACROYT_G034608 [Oculina patagonica]
MKLFQLILLGCSALQVQAYRNNPSILWDSKNPIFQTNYSLAVRSASDVRIVCPNPAMIPIAVEGSIPMEKLYENLWIVDKQAYDTCAVNTSKYQNRFLMRCDTPRQLRYFRIVFQPFAAEPSQLVFQKGKDYFFIATSNGRNTSLDQTSGGRCATHNMRMRVYVCKDANDLKCQGSPVSTAQPPTKTVTVCPSPSQTVLASSTTTQTMPCPNLKCQSSPVSTAQPPTKTVTVCPSPTKTVLASSTTTQTMPCPTVPDKHQVSELLNNTRLLPEIFNHTSQLTDLWAQVKNMSDKLNAVQEKLENCSFGGGNGHMTLQTTTLIPATTPIPTQPVYANCAVLYNAGFKVSGVYNIAPGDGLGSFPVYCDQTTAGGGWTVLQKRFDGSVRFSNQKWVEYQNGFGHVTGEYWLGLDRIHRLTKNPVMLRFDLGAPDGRRRFAVYQGFTVAGAGQKYQMTSGNYIVGDAGDSFSFESGSKFSTVDQDNDKWKNHCAQTFKSGWWHAICHKASLNGLYLNGSDTDPAHLAAGITWHSWTGYKYFLTKSEMKIKP